MDNIPLHPALVHIPLGLAFILPVLTLAISFFIFKKKMNKSLVYVLIMFQILLSASAFMALKSGEEEEEKVEKVVSEKYIERHEESAEAFLTFTFVVLAFSILSSFAPESKLKLALSLLLLAQLSTLFFVYRVGHSGGELVFKHNAGSAYQ